MLPSTYNLYPEISPYHFEHLQVTNSHEIYYEECGSPNGQPIIFLHGGPGSGCNSSQRRFFDPNHYRIILTDQRGCGRSKPLGETIENTTEHLVHDLEKLRHHLNIESWIVFGGSWGSTLGIAYAIAHPACVKGLILRGIFLSRPSELDWFLKDVSQFFPEALQQLRGYLPESERDQLLDAYSSRIFSDDVKLSVPAAIAWNAFESSIMSLRPSTSNNAVSDDIQVARAKIQLHYILNECFVGQRNLLQEVSTISHIPTVIVQGRYDMVCPPITAWELKQALPDAEYYVIDDAGHSAMEPGTTSALISATDRFKSL